MVPLFGRKKGVKMTTWTRKQRNEEEKKERMKEIKKEKDLERKRFGKKIRCPPNNHRTGFHH